MLSDGRRVVRQILNSIQLAAVAASQIIEGDVSGHVDIHQRSDASRKSGGSGVARTTGHANESAAIVAEEVATGVLGGEVRNRRSVERGPNDRAVRARVLVCIDRIANARDARRRVAFSGRPTEVG